MRASVGVLGGIVALMVGYLALGEAAQQAHDNAIANGTNASARAFNFTTEIYNGLGIAGADAIVWGGVAAFILISLGLLVGVVGGGR